MLKAGDSLVGGAGNKLAATDAVLNVEKSKAARALAHFRTKDPVDT